MSVHTDNAGRRGARRALRHLTATVSAAALTTGALIAAAPSASAVPEDPGTERVSVATGGAPGNGVSHGVDLSGDGQVVVFGSAADNLVPDGTTKFDLYVRDRNSGATEIVSVNNAGQSGTSTSLWPSISSDGNRVAFHSIATNLVANDDNSPAADVFVRDRAADTTTLISRAADGGVANGRSERAEISADGKHVVFQSGATDIVAGVPANTSQVYIHHLESGQIELVSQSTGGTAADRSAGQASVSGDGRYVVFQSYATTLTQGPPYSELYVRDTVEGRTRVVEGVPRFPRNPAISGNGQYIFFTTGGGSAAYIATRTGSKPTRVPIGGGRQGLATSRFSNDGRYVAVFGDSSRLFVFDRITGSVTEGSLNDDGTQVASGSRAPNTFGPPGISDDGRIVGFWSTADGVVAGDTGGIEDVFVRDRGDLLGPAISEPTFGPEELLASEPVVITATADDAGRGDAIIAAAEVSIDGRDWIAMEAADGAFDSVSEAVTTTVESLRSGGHEVCVRATDGRGNVSVTRVCGRVVLESSTFPLAVSVLRVATDPARALPHPFELNKELFANVWAVPADGSLPKGGDWDYSTRADDDANTIRYRAGEIEPFGTHGENITTGTGRALVAIQAGLTGPGGGIIDLNPRANFTDLRFTVDLETGEWSNIDGLVPYPVSCLSSPPNLDADTIRGELCFGVSTMSTSGDVDGDGLLDLWETIGVNTDEDADIELDLPGWGATPDHKDLFVEYDVERDAVWDTRTQNGLIAAQNAFARAPVDAGGISNPDGQPGIRLWVDAPAVLQNNGQPNSQSSQLALTGSNNGERIGTGEICGVNGNFFDNSDDGFYNAKARNFDDDRRWVFRYAIKESADDPDCASGGQAEIGGNDFVVFNHGQSGSTTDNDGNRYSWPGGETFMHELGHTLGLRHGGFQNKNHKPNYVSLMNYSYSFTLRQAGNGNGFLDFSPVLPPPASGPATVPAGPRPLLLPTIKEGSPPQGTVLGADRDHDLLYASYECDFTAIPVSDPFTLFPGNDLDVSLPHPGLDAKLSELPGSCVTLKVTPGTTQTLADHDDWSAVRLSFHQSGYSADGAVNPSDDEEFPTDEETAELREALTTTDVSVALEGPTGPVTAGQPFDVIATVTNQGTVTALSPEVTFDFGEALSLQQATPGCAGEPLVCSLESGESAIGPISAGGVATVSVSLVAGVEGDTSVDVMVSDPATTDTNDTNNAVSLALSVDPAPDTPGDEEPGDGTPGDGTPGDEGDTGGDEVPQEEGDPKLEGSDSNTDEPTQGPAPQTDVASGPATPAPVGDSVSPTAPPSEASAVPAADADSAASDGGLPQIGASVGPVVLLGIALVGTGALLSRRRAAGRG